MNAAQSEPPQAEPSAAVLEARRLALAWIDEHTDELTEFCKDFVRYPSVFTEERQVQDEFVEPFLRDGGYDEVTRHSDDPDQERPNLSAVWRGAGGGRSLLYNGHCDVVPVYEHERKHRWHRDPFDPVVEDGNLYGRGSTDMKGGISAYLWAVRALQELDLQLAGDVISTVVIGEESAHPHFGCLPTMRREMEARGKPDLTIVAEPTHNELHAISGGFFGIEIEIQGKEVHISERNLMSWPQRYGIPQGEAVGVDALKYLRELLNRLEQLERRWVMSYRHPLMGGGGYPLPIDRQGVAPFFIAVGRAEAGDWMGSVPGHARIEGGVLYPGWVDVEEIKVDLRAEIDAWVSRDPWLVAHPPTVRIAERYDVPPFSLPLDHPACEVLSEAYETATGKHAVLSGFKGVHDGCYMQQQYGIDVITFGPGDLVMGAHGANEYVPIEQLVDCASAFAVMTIDWCGLAGE
ncbi:MAG: M20/M25/M40 family metallo-hydrolase [Actinomycetia bacterium]|nr:M20/M25/M40 family metallo-hydrolase [Actinomycetes bacterium]